MRFRLYGAYPNPFNPRTTLRFDTPAANHIDLSVYDAAGRRVRTLRSGVIPQGRWSIVWDGTDEHGRQLASGVYFVKLLSGKFLGTSKTILMR
jgi:flagellar hook assembly protein FlgD